MFQGYQESTREKLLYKWTGLFLLILLIILIGFSIHRNRTGRIKTDQEVNKGIQLIRVGLDGNCSAFDAAKKRFFNAARSRIWLNRETAWIGFCEDLEESCGQNPDQLEDRLKKIIGLGEHKLVHEAKFQLALLKIRRKDFSASKLLLEELARKKAAYPRAERYLVFLNRLKVSINGKDL